MKHASNLLFAFFITCSVLTLLGCDSESGGILSGGASNVDDNMARVDYVTLENGASGWCEFKVEDGKVFHRTKTTGGPSEWKAVKNYTETGFYTSNRLVDTPLYIAYTFGQEYDFADKTLVFYEVKYFKNITSAAPKNEEQDLKPKYKIGANFLSLLKEAYNNRPDVVKKKSIDSKLAELNASSNGIEVVYANMPVSLKDAQKANTQQYRISKMMLQILELQQRHRNEPNQLKKEPLLKHISDIESKITEDLSQHGLDAWVVQLDSVSSLERELSLYFGNSTKDSYSRSDVTYADNKTLVSTSRFINLDLKYDRAFFNGSLADQKTYLAEMKNNQWVVVSTLPIRPNIQFHGVRVDINAELQQRAKDLPDTAGILHIRPFNATQYSAKPPKGFGDQVALASDGDRLQTLEASLLEQFGGKSSQQFMVYQMLNAEDHMAKLLNSYKGAREHAEQYKESWKNTYDRQAIYMDQWQYTIDRVDEEDGFINLVGSLAITALGQESRFFDLNLLIQDVDPDHMDALKKQLTVGKQMAITIKGDYLGLGKIKAKYDNREKTVSLSGKLYLNGYNRHLLRIEPWNAIQVRTSEQTVAAWEREAKLKNAQSMFISDIWAALPVEERMLFFAPEFIRKNIPAYQIQAMKDLYTGQAGKDRMRANSESLEELIKARGLKGWVARVLHYKPGSKNLVIGFASMNHFDKEYKGITDAHDPSTGPESEFTIAIQTFQNDVGDIKPGDWVQLDIVKSSEDVKGRLILEAHGQDIIDNVEIGAIRKLSIEAPPLPIKDNAVATLPPSSKKTPGERTTAESTTTNNPPQKVERTIKNPDVSDVKLPHSGWKTWADLKEGHPIYDASHVQYKKTISKLEAGIAYGVGPKVNGYDDPNYEWYKQQIRSKLSKVKGVGSIKTRDVSQGDSIFNQYISEVKKGSLGITYMAIVTIENNHAVTYWYVGPSKWIRVQFQPKFGKADFKAE